MSITSKPSARSLSLDRRPLVSRPFLAACLIGVLAPLASAQLGSAVRVLPESTFTDNGCNAPCVCIIAPTPQPVGGRFYLAPAPSTPNESRIAGAFELVTINPLAAGLEGTADLTTALDPARISTLRLQTAYGGVSWTLTSNPFIIENDGIIAQLVSPQSDCTTLHVSLRAVETCVADFDNGSGRGLPDGGVTIDDLLHYLTIFELGKPLADIDDGSGLGMPDGGVTIDDLLEFLEHFDMGC